MENVRQFPTLTTRISRNEDFVGGKKVKKKRLINKLNSINFSGGTVLARLRHVRYQSTLIQKVRPLPCLGGDLFCGWGKPADVENDIESYQLLEILVPDDPNLIILKSEPAIINKDGLRLRLPESCVAINRRKAQRYRCKDIKAKLIQNSVEFLGTLLEFSSFSFHVEIQLTPPQTFKWIDPVISATLILEDERQIYYSGPCKILKQSDGFRNRSYILEPFETQTHRFKPREFRSTRQELVPMPNMIFQHPLIKKAVNLKVLNISGLGFAVEEDEDKPVLIPGMIIPEAELNFAGSFSFNCRVQVVYRKESCDPNEKVHRLKCGLTFLEIGIDEHRKLLALLQQAIDPHSYLSAPVDLDVLWDFFFESGFIYPEKYNSFEANKDSIKRTYQKLYTCCPEIVRHFTYQDKGRILGHVAMVQIYNNSWLIQHHSAITSASFRAGVAVLNQVGQFLNNSVQLNSSHMEFVCTYFRTENKFPERIFGGITRQINNPKACSIDSFAYLHYSKLMTRAYDEEAGWTLAETRPSDLEELKNYYEYISGGLLLQVFGLEADALDIGNLSEKYQKLGLKRERYLYSLWKNHSLKAILMANISDIGVNFSDLTNCIQAFIIDSETLPRNILLRVLSIIAPKYEKEEIPILLYPTMYAENQSIPYEKSYKLWVMKTEYGDDYLRSLKQLLGHIHH